MSKLHKMLFILTILNFTFTNIQSQKMPISKELENKRDSFETSLNIDLLYKAGENNDYYVNLKFLADNLEIYPYHVYTSLDMSAIDTISYDKIKHIGRISLNKDTINKYFLSRNLDYMLVFDKTQNLIDTIYRNNFENLLYLRGDKITSIYVASYHSLKNLHDSFVISKMGFDKFSHKKNPTFEQNEKYINRIFKKNKFKADTIYSSGYFKYKADTISFVSFENEENSLTSFYILKNGDIMCSEINYKKPINEFIPVPIQNNDEIFYLARSYSSSDENPAWSYNFAVLKSLNLKTMKIKDYSKNRIKYQP